MMSQIWDKKILEANKELWDFELTSGERNEVEDLLFGTDQISFQDTPTLRLKSSSALKSKLEAGIKEVDQGFGVFSLRGFNSSEYTERQCMMIHLFIGSHVGNLRPQPGGGLLDHITDINKRKQGLRLLYSQTDQHMHFHTDSCDVASLMCYKNAAFGGESQVASGLGLYQAMASRHSDLCPYLFDPLPYSRNVEVQVTQEPWFMMPVFNHYQDELLCYYNPQYAEMTQRLHPAAPRLKEQHYAALAALAALLKSGEFVSTTKFEEGQIQFLNNHSCLHARTDYVDGDSAKNTRHLFRLWLSPESARPLPEYYASRWGSTQPGVRGGIKTSTTSMTVLTLDELVSKLKPI